MPACYAGVLMARIDPWGHVYPCLEQHVCVGSVRDELVCQYARNSSRPLQQRTATDFRQPDPAAAGTTTRRLIRSLSAR
ncbi:MAG: hypothetical protein MZV70_55910 [Desulfobacterales bacterium]|nr:hypothetical protein [Desulfobacterales bacterium]